MFLDQVYNKGEDNDNILQLFDRSAAAEFSSVRRLWQATRAPRQE